MKLSVFSLSVDMHDTISSLSELYMCVNSFSKDYKAGKHRGIVAVYTYNAVNNARIMSVKGLCMIFPAIFDLRYDNIHY